MRWHLKTRRDSHHLMMEAATAEVLRTRDDYSRVRDLNETLTQELALCRDISKALTQDLALCQSEGRALQREAELHQREARLRQLIGTVITRYFIKGDRSAETSIDYTDIEIDSNPDWIPELMARTGVSEPEFAIFKYFSNDDGVILDIGANFGYAAASMWAAGATSKILSFEPNPWHEPCLQRIKELRGHLFDHVGIGLGSRAGDTRFVIPVIEGIGISALGSAAIEMETDWTIPENVLRHMMQDHPDLDAPGLRFTEVTWRIERLDDVLANREFEVDVADITAMKIDVEGFEAEVLRGAIQTLRTHRPLIMIEGANRNPAVVDCLSPIGYVYAEFSDDVLVLSDQQSSRVNGFFLHGDRLDHYRAIGLLGSLRIPVT
jgi:FkbM family methyltransferase